MTKNRQIGKNSPKWLKVLKLGSKGFQGVPDGSRSQTAWARTTRGTYARAPYAFAALGQGPKGPELVRYKQDGESAPKFKLKCYISPLLFSEIYFYWELESD